MNPATVVLLVLAGGFAGLNWWSQAVGSLTLEYVSKPAVTALLAAAAVTLDPQSTAARPWFVAALLLSLAGDVLLMLPGDRFVAGLAAFLLAHVLYVVGFLVGGVHGGAVLVGVAVVFLALVPLARVIVRGARRTDPSVVGAVVVYIVVISCMVAAAFGSWRIAAIVGALLFAASDSLIAWNRFVGATPAAQVVIMVTYHLGQLGLLLSLVH
ncbi:MAG TPA: lysoplasmalogenase [Acidimicrobiia bacterium]|jgi:uncharacterized membrane protein YhhN